MSKPPIKRFGRKKNKPLSKQIMDKEMVLSTIKAE